MRVASSGFSHPHWNYFAAEVEARRAAGEPVEVVGVQLDPDDPDDPADRVVAWVAAPRFATPAELLDAHQARRADRLRDLRHAD